MFVTATQKTKPAFLCNYDYILSSTAAALFRSVGSGHKDVVSARSALHLC